MSVKVMFDKFTKLSINKKLTLLLLFPFLFLYFILFEQLNSINQDEIENSIISEKLNIETFKKSIINTTDYQKKLDDLIYDNSLIITNNPKIDYLKKLVFLYKTTYFEFKYINYLIEKKKISKKDLILIKTVSVLNTNVLYIDENEFSEEILTYKNKLNDLLSDNRESKEKNIILKKIILEEKIIPIKYLKKQKEKMNLILKNININKINSKPFSFFNNLNYIYLLILINTILILIIILFVKKSDSESEDFLKKISNLNKGKYKIDSISNSEEFFKQINNDLNKKNKVTMEDLEEISSSKDLFLSGISHEVRTPLNAIIGFSDLLKDSNLNEEEMKYVHIIHDNSTHLLHFLSEHIKVINSINLEEKKNIVSKINSKINILLFEKTNEILNSINQTIKSEYTFNVNQINDNELFFKEIKNNDYNIIIIDIDNFDISLFKKITIYENEMNLNLLKIGISYHNKYKVEETYKELNLKNCFTKPLRNNDILYILNMTLFND